MDVQTVAINLAFLFLVIFQIRIIKLSKRVENLERDRKTEDLLNRMLTGKQ